MSQMKGMRNNMLHTLNCHIQMKDKHHSNEMAMNQKYMHGDRVESWICKFNVILSSLGARGCKELES